MDRVILSLAALLIFGCSALPREQVAPLRGRLELSVEPNPIVAHPLGAKRAASE
jgi:hypothetical protein